MQHFRIALAALLTLAPFAAHARQDRFVYVGNTLQPKTGNGIQGVTYIRFTLTGRHPPKGKCEKHLTLVTLFDGIYSPKILMARGFVESPESRIEVCADPVTGQLTEKLVVEMDLFSQGNLIAGYTWNSHDPKKGKTADLIESYENVEYHTSITKRAGHFSAHRIPGE